MVSPAEARSIFAGTGQLGYSGDGGSATAAELDRVTGVTADDGGDVYVVECGGNVVRRVSPDGIITTVAGLGGRGYGKGGNSGDGGPATEAELRCPLDAAIDPSGNLFIADRTNSVIRRVDPSGVISTFAGGGTVALTTPSPPFEVPATNRIDGSDRNRLGGECPHRGRGRTPRLEDRPFRQPRRIRRHGTARVLRRWWTGRQGATVPVFRDERQGRGDLETRETAELLWRILDELVEHAEQHCGVFQVVEDRTGEHLVHLVELVFQRRHHAEVATAASQTPEQVLVLACAGGEELSVRGDHIGGEEVVDGKSVCPRQAADTAPKGEAGDAGGRDDAARCRQSECVGCMVEVAQGGAGVSAGRFVPWSTRTVRIGVMSITRPPSLVPNPGSAVSAVPDGQVEPVVAGEVRARNDISHLLGPEHSDGPLDEHAVVNGAHLLVVSVITGEHLASHLLTQRLNVDPARRPLDSYV